MMESETKAAEWRQGWSQEVDFLNVRRANSVEFSNFI
jgi:hypothetical protein